MADSIVIRKVETKKDHAHSVQVRTLVFVVGQNVPAAREIDEDEDLSHYYIAMMGDGAVGTVRWRRDGDLAKIERLAVLDSVRGKGIGKKLMNYILEDIKKSGVEKIKLGSQDHAIPFYESLGFSVFGEGYMDGGTIPHHDMILKLKK